MDAATAGHSGSTKGRSTKSGMPRCGWDENMVVIQCPHCNLEVELEDGESGLFDCPHCGKEFQWGKMDEKQIITY